MLGGRSGGAGRRGGLQLIGGSSVGEGDCLGPTSLQWRAAARASQQSAGSVQRTAARGSRTAHEADLPLPWSERRGAPTLAQELGQGKGEVAPVAAAVTRWCAGVRGRGRQGAAARSR
eukprot:scaffold155745_cov32-Tisochrysis_lutea.AAC.2